MSWRRGEVWLDAEGGWFGEGAGSVAAAPTVLPLPAIPSFGLVASRQRRSAWEQRRHRRRVRATVLALSPAMLFSVATVRSGGIALPGFLADDPPSETYRLSGLSPAELWPVAARRGIDRVEVERDVPPVAPVGTRRAAPADEAPEVVWHQATSIGLPYAGRLVDGTQLPLEGPDWVTWNPVTDSSPNLPHRLYGNERTIRAILSVTAAYRAASPDAPRVVIGDISRLGGGPMTDEHASHQNGLDVDVYFPRVDHALRAPTAPSQIDHRLAQDLLDRFVAAGARMIFVGYGTGLHGPSGVVIPYQGHQNHMHVRFANPG